MELRFCDECGNRIGDGDFADGRAVESDDFCYCPRCYKKKQRAQKKKDQLAAPAEAAEKPKPKPEPKPKPGPVSTARLKRTTPGGGGTPEARVRRDTPATVKLPAGPRKPRSPTSKMSLPAPRRRRPSSSGLERLGEEESEAADWGRTVFNGIMLLIGGLLLGYLGFMLLSRQSGVVARKPVGGKASSSPSPRPESKPSPQADS